MTVDELISILKNGYLGFERVYCGLKCRENEVTEVRATSGGPALFTGIAPNVDLNEASDSRRASQHVEDGE